MGIPNNPGGRKGDGNGVRFLRALLERTEGGCVIWPFFRDKQGRGVLGHLGKVWQAHRLMCILAHGEPPSRAHHAAHSCGRGHEGCVSPWHLSWKTPEANALDMVAHGRATSAGSARKLTRAQALQIRAMRGQKTYDDLAAIYGVRWETIGDIMRGRTHQDRPSRYGRSISPQERVRLSLEAARLRATGKTYNEIATLIGVSRVTARRYSKTAVRGGNR